MSRFATLTLTVLLTLPVVSLAQQAAPPSPPQPYAELNRRLQQAQVSLQQAQWAQQDFTQAIQEELAKKDQQIQQLQHQLTEAQHLQATPPAPPSSTASPEKKDAPHP